MAAIKSGRDEIVTNKTWFSGNFYLKTRHGFKVPNVANIIGCQKNFLTFVMWLLVSSLPLFPLSLFSDPCWRESEATLALNLVARWGLSDSQTHFKVYIFWLFIKYVALKNLDARLICIKNHFFFFSIPHFWKQLTFGDENPIIFYRLLIMKRNASLSVINSL